ncbi:MAG: diguanylate cyclase [Pirellulaceae bacterium]
MSASIMFAAIQSISVVFVDLTCGRPIYVLIGLNVCAGQHLSPLSDAPTMIKTSCRLAITLGLIAASVIWIAHGLDMVPDSEEERIGSRLRLCESLAVTTTWFAQRNQTRGLDDIIEQIGKRSPEVRSIAIVKQSRTIASFGPHEACWKPASDGQSSPESMAVGILANESEWGEVQVQFWPLSGSTFFGSHGTLALIIFCGATFALLGWLFLARSLKYLNPSRVVPSRVRNALDAMVEGLVLQDVEGQIVMVNESFAKIVDQPVDQLLGETPDRFGWESLDASDQENEMRPWQAALNQGVAQRGHMLGLPEGKGKHRKFIVNSTPILEESGKCRGALTSFDDVTALEDKRAELSRMLQILKSSRDEIRRQNEHLHYLASRDSLTGCLNRRSFFGQLEERWASAQGQDLAVIMMDIDHFKSINDNFGHSTGDEVIKRVAQVIRDVVGDQGITGRYGGEEFCAMVPGCDGETAREIAEDIREAISSEPIQNVDVTMSLGVSAREYLAMDPQHIVEQADQSLYAAKNGGRNRVVTWHHITTGEFSSGDAPIDQSYGDSAGFISPVEHQAIVAALFSSLFYRDQRTALHSARVASVAAAVGRHVLDEPVVNVLKVAALLHDIGKIGIPDSVLHKPHRLADHERVMMERRDNIAVAICKSAQVSPDVAQVIENYDVHFRNGSGLADLNLHQPRIATACRILHICDAFDSMINETEYRKAKSLGDALLELQNCAPEQFDPELVDKLLYVVGNEPDCLMPVDVPGACVDDNADSDTINIVAAAQAGDLEPLRLMMRRLKREALSENGEIQDTITQLEDSLNKNDEELQTLFETTRQLLEICRENRERETLTDEYELFPDWGTSNGSSPNNP